MIDLTAILEKSPKAMKPLIVILIIAVGGLLIWNTVLENIERRATVSALKNGTSGSSDSSKEQTAVLQSAEERPAEVQQQSEEKTDSTREIIATPATEHGKLKKVPLSAPPQTPMILASEETENVVENISVVTSQAEPARLAEMLADKAQNLAIVESHSAVPAEAVTPAAVRPEIPDQNQRQFKLIDLQAAAAMLDGSTLDLPPPRNASRPEAENQFERTKNFIREGGQAQFCDGFSIRVDSIYRNTNNDPSGTVVLQWDGAHSGKAKFKRGQTFYALTKQCAFQLLGIPYRNGRHVVRLDYFSVKQSASVN